MKVVYAKKYLLPSSAANVLQSISMCSAFAQAGAEIVFFPGLKGITIEEGLNSYGLTKIDGMNPVSITGFHKGLYGLGFRLGILSKWFFTRNSFFYARDIKEAFMIAKLKRLGLVNHPFFYEMHEVLSIQNRGMKTGREKKFRELEKQVLEAIDGLIVINQSLEEQVRSEYGYAGPILCEPMGYNPDIFYPRPDVDLDGPVTISYVGSLYEGKGVHNLVEAFRFLGPEFRLLIIGGTPAKELEELKRRAAIISNDGRISFLGQLPQKQLPEFLEQSQLVVIPQKSTLEFFSPIKLYETIGMALPLVVTPLPIFKNCLKDCENAVFAESSSPEDLAAAIKKCVYTPNLAHKIQEANRNLSSGFTWKQRASRIIEFMESVYSSKRGEE